MEVPQKNKSRTSCVSATPLLSEYTEELNTGTRIDTAIPMFIEVLFTIAQN